ncbi:MAG: hypothetical protein AAGI48_08900 [Verrucomicrobiota bacterium]
MIFKLIALGLMLNSAVPAQDESAPTQLREWENWDLESFSSREPARLDAVFRSFVGEHPPDAVEAEVGYQLGANEELREWLPDYFRTMPVLWENYSERANTLYMVHHIRAEWAVRFLLELTLDDRPMTTEKFDYDEVWRDIQERVRLGGNAEAIMADVSYYQLSETGEPRGANDLLARSALRKMNLAGSPNSFKQETSPLTTAAWLRLPSNRNRIPEIVRETWGEKAVLNVGLGLGPDNRPLSMTDSSSARPRGTSISGGAGPSAVESDEAGNDGSRSMLPLIVALGVLIVACVLVLLRRKQAAG